MRTFAAFAGLLLALESPFAWAQVSCALSGQMLADYISGGGYFVGGGIQLHVPGSKGNLAVYCEGSGQFPPPTIAGATYAWSTGETTQRIEYTTPPVEAVANFSVTVTTSAGTTNHFIGITGTPAGAPVCSVTSDVPQPIAQGVPFVVTAQCSPAATSFQWTPRSFTGSISIIGPSDGPSLTLVIDNSQPGDVMPIYLTPANSVGRGPYASMMATAGFGPEGPSVSAPRIAGGGLHTCALTSAGGVKCWGGNSLGQLGGFGNNIVSRTTPSNVIGAAIDVREVTAGYGHTCVRTRFGTVKCWGFNANGQLGDGSTVTSSLPVDVLGLSGVAQIDAGASGWHTCAVTQAGGAKCWGLNNRGQLGTGNSTDASTPQDVVGLTSGVSAIAAGGGHTCALMTRGGVKCWGRNSEGQLGNGGLTDSSVPVDVVALSSGVAAIATAHSHTCALMQAGGVKCWGWNGEGELGNGGFASASTPQDVPGIAGAVALTAEGNHSCATTSAGLKCWGRNTEGQLGDGTTVNRPFPVAVRNVVNVTDAISAGGFHTCALLAGGTATCWGQNISGQLGVGTYVSSSMPAIVVIDRGAGALDAGDWYLDLDFGPASDTLPAAMVPKLLVVAAQTGDTAIALDSTVKYRNAELGKLVKNYVLGLVPPSFFDQVRTAPGTSQKLQQKLQAGAGETLVLAQLTPDGWTTVDGQLIAYSSGVANSAGGAARILDGVVLPTGSRFCVGYGESADAMLGAQALREVLVLEGVANTASGVPCVLTGIYVDGPPSSLAGTPVTFNASVIGLTPTGSVQFKDGLSNLLSPITLSFTNEAVARASITTASLSTGLHGIGASYSGDSDNVAATTEIPLKHEVKAAAPSSSTTELRGPSSSELGTTATFSAIVTGNNVTGSVQFKDGGANLGAAEPVVGGIATLRTSSLAAGAHSIGAVYSGDLANAASASSVLSHTVYTVLTTSADLTSNVNPSDFGSPVTLSATVTGNNPTGEVVFRNGAATLAIVPLAGGNASLTLSSLPLGLNLLTATYMGDGNNQMVTSPTLFQQVYGACSASDGDIDGVPGCVELAEGLDPAVKDNDIFANARLFAMQQYRDFLNREGDFGGITFWTNQIQSRGQTRSQCVESFFNSAEFQGTVAPVVRLYFAYFLRVPDYGGLQFWINYFKTHSLDDISNNFAASPEFQNTYGPLNNTQYVTLVYNNVLGRAPDNEGLNFWVNQLNTGQRTRGQVMLEFSESAENRALSFVDVYVTMMYVGMLRRSPDNGGFDFWTGYMASGNSGLALIGGFLAAPEYRSRFLP